MKDIILTEEIFSDLQDLLNRNKQNCKQCEKLFIKLTQKFDIYGNETLSFDVIDKNGNSMKNCFGDKKNAE